LSIVYASPQTYSKQFVSLNTEKDIVGYLREGYEPFHLTGDDGVLEELDNYVYG
jgi:hypothetical protein